MKMFAISFAINAALGASFNSAMSAGVNKLQALQNKTAELTGKERRLNMAWNASQRAAANYQSEMWALTQSYKSGGMSQNEYSRAVAQAKSKMQQATMSAEVYREQLSRIRQESANVSTRMNSMQAFGAAQGNFTNALKGAGAAIAAVGMAAAPIKAVMETSMGFSAAMSKVKAITGASAEEMAKLKDQASELGATTQFTATQAADAMTYLGMAGWNTQQIMAGMPGMLDLAAASGSDLANVADIVSDDLTAFGMSAEQAGHMADVMAAASTNANTNVEMMGMTFKYAGAVAGALGYSLEDVSVATGLMANAGIKGEQAGTSLRAIMNRLVAPPASAARAMEQLGISVTNADGSMKPFSQTMKDLRAKFAGLNDAEKAELASSIAGTEAMSGFLAVVNASDADFDKLTNAVNNADGAAARMAKTMQDNAKGDLTSFLSAVEGVAIAIGDGLEPILRAGLQPITAMARGFAAWAKDNKGLITTLGEVAAGAVAAFTAFKIAPVATSFIRLTRAGIVEFMQSTAAARGVVASFVSKLNALTPSGILWKVSSAFSSVKGAVTSFLSVVRGISIGGVIQSTVAAVQGLRTAMLGIARAGIGAMFSPIGIAVMALAATAYYCYNNWETVGPMFMTLLDTIQAAFSNAWAMLQPALQGLFDAFGTLSTIVGENSGIFATLAEILGGAVVGAFVTVATVAVNALATGIGVIASLVTGLMGIFTGLIQFITGVFTGEWTAAWEGVKNIFNSVFNTIANIADRVLGGIKNTLNNIANTVGKLHIGGGGGSAIAHNAAGGIYNKGAFLTTFAEEGPEAAIPLDGSPRAMSLWQRAGEILGMFPEDTPEVQPYRQYQAETTASAGRNMGAMTASTKPQPVSAMVDHNNTVDASRTINNSYATETNNNTNKNVDASRTVNNNQTYENNNSTTRLIEHFTPPPITINITVNGEAKVERIKDAVMDAGRQMQRSFAEQMEEFMHNRGRLSFG